MKTFTAQYGMSALDIASYCYGDASQIFQLRKDNPNLDINMGDFTGVKINYTPNNNSNSVKRLFTNLIPATSIINKNLLLQEDGFAFDLEDGSGKIELEN
jgi:hypothetical protein